MWNYQITTYQMFSVLFPFSWYRYSIHYATFHVIDFGIIGDFNIAWPTIFHIHLQNHLLYLSSENGSMCSHKATLTRCEYNANWLNNLFFFLNEILHHMYITTATYKHFLACMWFSLQTHLLSVAAVINNILYCMYNHYSFPSLVNWLQLAMAFCFCWWFLVLLFLLSSPLLFFLGTWVRLFQFESRAVITWQTWPDFLIEGVLTLFLCSLLCYSTGVKSKFVINKAFYDGIFYLFSVPYCKYYWTYVLDYRANNLKTQIITIFLILLKTFWPMENCHWVVTSFSQLFLHFITLSHHLGYFNGNDPFRVRLQVSIVLSVLC